MSVFVQLPSTMKWFLGLFIAVALVTIVIDGRVVKREDDFTIDKEEENTLELMRQLEEEILAMRNRDVIAAWKFDSNITDYNEKIKNEANTESAKRYKVSGDGARRFSGE